MGTTHKRREDNARQLQSVQTFFAKGMNCDELILEKRCRAHARRFGWACCKLEKNGCKGIPDDLFISADERYMLIEFKRDEHQRARPEQLAWLRRLPNTSRLVCSFEEFCKALGLPYDADRQE